MPDQLKDHSDRIAAIRGILRTGASSVNVDGQQVAYDLESLRRELRELEAEDVTEVGLHGRRRPRATRMNLGGF